MRPKFISEYLMIKAMSFDDCCLWLARPIYSIETHKLCSAKEYSNA